RSVRLGLAQPIEISAEAFQRTACRLDQLQVCQRVEEQATNQEFDREVIDALFPEPPGCGATLQKDVDDAVTYRQRRGPIPIRISRGFARLAQGVGQLRLDRVAKLGFVVITP